MTAQRIAQVLGCSFYPEPAIREIVKREEQMQGFRGMTVTEMRRECPGVAPEARLPYPWWTAAAEDEDAVLARARPFLEDLVSRRDGDVLLVGHGASVGAATRFFLSLCQVQYTDLPLSWNCSLTAFKVGACCRVLLMRDTQHLPDEDVTSNARRLIEVPES